MSRPRKCRCVQCRPNCNYFKPRGIPLVDLEETTLTMDEVEALRLADHEGLYHEKAAQEMQVSRATFGRILGNARKKTAEAIITGKALRIERPEEQGPCDADRLSRQASQRGRKAGSLPPDPSENCPEACRPDDCRD